MSIDVVVNIVAIALILVFGLIGFLRGRKRGPIGGVADIVFLLINVVSSIFLSGWIASLFLSPEMIYNILDLINGDAVEGTLVDVMEQMEIYMQEGEFLATADLSLVFALFEVILTPIIFIASFFVLGLILWVVKLILYKLLIPKTKNMALRIIGGGMGAVKNVLVFAIYLAPIIGFATYGLNTLDMASQRVENEELLEINEQAQEFAPIVTEGTFNVINVCGGEWLFEMLATTHVDDVEVSLVDETENVLNIYEAIVPLTKISSVDFTSNEADLIDTAIDEIENSEYLTALVASLMSQSAQEINENNKLFTLERPYFGDSFDPVAQMLLDVWAETTRSGLVDDLRTYSQVFRSTVEHGLYKQLNSPEGDVFIVLEDSTFYSEILQSLHQNERTRDMVPTVADAMQCYLYEVYEEINGKPYGTGDIEPVDKDALNEATLNEESIRIAKAVQEIRKFSKSTETAVYVEEIVKQGDFVALGTGLNQMRDSVLFYGSYKFLLDSILHSEACAKLGIIDNNFVQNAIGDPYDRDDDADMVQLLVSRQHLAMLTIAMWDGDKAAQEDSLKTLIANLAFDPNDPLSVQKSEAEMQALKELAALDNLERYGVNGEKGNTVSTITESLVDTIHDHTYIDKNGDGIVDQTDIDMEAAETAHVVTVLTSAQNSEEGVVNAFDTGDGVSKTGESAEQFVSDILASTIAAEMMETAISEKGENPYGLHGTLSESDTQSLEAALAAQYESDPTKGSTLEDLASVLGVNFSR